MFQEYVKLAINKFDNMKGFNYVEPEDILEDIKQINKYIHEELKYQYYMFHSKKKKKDIYKSLNMFCENNIDYADTINRFIGSLNLLDGNFESAKNYFLKANDYECSIYACMELYNISNSKEQQEEAIELAKKMLNIICKPKSKEEEETEYIDYSIYRLVMDDCIQKDNFSYIIFLIDMMYSSFRKNDKYETFYYCLIKLANIKSIKLSFQQNKDFFSRENFQTVCYKVKEELSSKSLNQEEVVISFEDNINRANELKTQKDFKGAENFYRQAITLATTVKQKHMAFKKIYEMYENIDGARMLFILDEFEGEDVFENEFQKCYFKSKMIIRTKSNNYDVLGNLKNLAKSIEEYEFDKKYPSKLNDLVIKCLELIKLYVQDMLNNEEFDDAHAGCKLAISLNKFNKRNHYKINEYISYFTTKQTLCGKIKKDLAKKGNSKINVSATAPLIDKNSIVKQTLKDPNDMPMFEFNNMSSNNIDYYIDQFNASCEETLNFDEKTILKQINSLLIPINLPKVIKSLYVDNNTFTGNHRQAREDIDFYINSNIRTNPVKKRDEYFSFVKILNDVILNLGENIQYSITNHILNEYIVQGLMYHSKGLKSKEGKQYFLFIAELIKKNINDRKYLSLEKLNESE